MPFFKRKINFDPDRLLSVSGHLPSIPFAGAEVLQLSKRPIARPIIPFKIRRELGEKITYDSELDELASKMKHGKIPLPKLRFPAEKLKQLREGGYTVELRDYIIEKV
ncbi:uncharacterized protein NPIL_67131 [Nephila pilipes]|uniref:Uncharacterized protein n=1 Tax=Nephila pilipes TaxID=299642 RepID=A0A8X6MSM5_NEPPI|nr:uncharacterized protein NPIL_67131 [Nephila pilipes]